MSELDYIILSQTPDSEKELWKEVKDYCTQGWYILQSLIMAHKGQEDKIYVILQRTRSLSV